MTTDAPDPCPDPADPAAAVGAVGEGAADAETAPASVQPHTGGHHGSRRITSLDGLRALAVALVFVHHVDQKRFSGGDQGVTVFFVLSGFLITSLILGEITKQGHLDVRSFYARRLLRLAPALVAVVLVAGTVAAIRGVGRPAWDSLFALAYLTDFWQTFRPHLNPLAHTWSLSVEEQFYLVWPLVLGVVTRRRRSVVWTVVTLIALSIVTTAVVGALRPGSERFLPTTHAAALGAGALLACMSRSARLEPWVRRLGTWWLMAGSLVFLAVALFTLHRLPAVGGPVVLAAVCAVPVAHLVTYRDSGFSRVFAAAPLVWLGERSYGFYLWHFPVLIFLGSPLPNPWLRAGVGLALTLALTMASWSWVETPFLRLKDRGFLQRPR